MANMFVRANSLEELKVLQRWLRDVNGMWTEIEEGTLTDDGHEYPLYAVEVFRCRVTKRRLTVQFVDRTESSKAVDAVAGDSQVNSGSPVRV